jgi:hypothetical protein
MSGDILLKASERGDLDEVNRLLLDGTEVNYMKEVSIIDKIVLIRLYIYLLKDGLTPLIWACNNGHVEVCEMLLKMGADIHHKNKVCIMIIYIYIS